MSQLSEIKCPACGEWSEWTGKTDEKCPSCDAHLDPVRFHVAEEKRIFKETTWESSYLLVKDTDDPIVQMLKQFINWLRWTTFYGISVLVFVVAIMVVAFGLVFV